MSPASFDPKSGVQGAAATLTVAGLAIGLLVGLYRPVFALVAGAAGAGVAIVVWITKARGSVGLLARLGLGLAVGAALAFVLNELGVLPTVGTR